MGGAGFRADGRDPDGFDRAPLFRGRYWRAGGRSAEREAGGQGGLPAKTLEQAVLAAGFYLALAAVATGPWLALLPTAAALFVTGRALFYFGYTRGAKGRSLGMSLTMLPSVIGYLVVAWLFVFGG
jgi:cation transport ATPase